MLTAVTKHSPTAFGLLPWVNEQANQPYDLEESLMRSSDDPQRPGQEWWER